MKSKPVIRRIRAERDLQTAADYYFSNAGVEIALAFVDAVEHAFRHIGGYLATGSTRYAHELDLPGLRSWPIKGYPYSLFYIERDNHIDLWRILHGQQEIPAWLGFGGSA